MAYPQTRTVEVSDDFFQTAVPDPYRWLEGPSEDPEIRDWVSHQARYAREALDALPGRTQIAARVGELASLPVQTAPRCRGDRWFRFVNDGTAEQLSYHVSDNPEQIGVPLIDPDQIGTGSTTSIASAVPSPDGRLVAYTYSEAGSDWQTWRVRSVETGQDLADEVPWAKFTAAEWLPDSSGFFYGCFPRPDEFSLIEANSGHRIQLHRLGVAEDQLVFELPDEPQVIFSAEISPDDQWLVIAGQRGTDPTNRLWISTVAELHPRPLIERDDAAWQLVDSLDGELVLFTDLDAPRGRVVALDLQSGALREIVAEQDDILSEAYAAGGRLLLHRLRDAHSVLTLRSLSGDQLDEIRLPGLGSVLEVQARRASGLLHLTYTSFATPRVVLQYDLDAGEELLLFDSRSPVLADIVTEQVRFTSADGTSIPMFLVHKTGMAVGPHPTLLYGYGGFRIPVVPAFNVSRAAFVAAGGVLAVPSLRGGGEYGVPWHDAGRLHNKQNVFDDAIAAAEYLVAQGWTSPGQLAVNGGSNGGLLVGALITQRPDLFAAAVPEVGVLDVLRFTHFTIGWAWTSDYGDPARSREEFLDAYAYSPYHRITDGLAVPDTLVMTSDHDDRVVPAHSYKFAARLQAAADPASVVLLRVELDGGHGAGRARSAVIAERTDALAFISDRVGLSWT
ncbi:prolyl oligopeptidase family serine peptidase [Jatrophihabitans telluris]|uniref:prolyl oligopeptidase n=1 Tax=Jatrophihabitans telluris TaxID=2038343 RepID=A0ABY4R289_9ACTN|nr:prolyl oligopeptidase family serine peptidase [Jatrophihabitans telluris]UQX89894.1 prolyl oligopeptidase family serine peptidase [Jatrophihabitans telluris]